VGDSFENQYTKLLNRIGARDTTPPEEFVALLYDELRSLARAQVRGPRGQQALQPTALVHEAWMKLARPEREIDWNDRRHFFRTAVQAMRSVLVDFARSRGAQKRGGGRQPLVLDEALHVSAENAEHLLELDAALEKLEALDPELSEVVQLRFFAGLSHEELATHLEVSVRTIERRWRAARLWLLDALQEGDGDEEGEGA